MTLGDGTAIGAAILSTIITIIGWGYTYKKQKELEKFKNILRQQDTRFTYIHNRRGKVLDTLYKKVSKINNDIRAYVGFAYNDFSFPSENLHKTEKSIYKLTKYFHQNKIYINKELSDSIEKFISTNIHVSNVIKDMVGNGLEQNNVSFDDNFDIVEDLSKEDIRKTIERLNQDIPPILKQIEDQIRNILEI